MAGVPEVRGPMETCLRKCSHALLLSKAMAGASWLSLDGAIPLSLVGASLASLVGAILASPVGAGFTVRALSAPVHAIIAPTSAAVEHAPRTLCTDTRKLDCTDTPQGLCNDTSKAPCTDIRQNLSAFHERQVIPPRVADVHLLWPRDLLIGVEQHLLPLRDPARRSRNRKQHREHRHREAQRLIDEAGVEVHVRIQPARDEVLVLEGDPFELE